MSLPADFDDEWASATEWARMYRACGLQVLPGVTPAEDPLNFKRPRFDWKEFQETAVPQAIFDRWYDSKTGEHRNRRNMGFACGDASNRVFCLDLDTHKDGSLARQWWADLLSENAHSVEPVTPSQRTGGGGRQLLFRAPVGWISPTMRTDGGIDVRGQGGFMVAPPSMHSSGKIYDWDKGRGPWQMEIIEAPEWLIDAIEVLKEQHGGQSSGTGGQRESTPSPTHKNAYGLDDDGREEKLRNMVWAAVVDLYRDSPIMPGQEAQDAEKSRIWQSFERTTKSRLQREGVSNADRLEAEGRGWSELDRKWRATMRKWYKEVAQASTVERVKEEPPPQPFVEGVGRAAPDEGQAKEQAPGGGQPAFDPWERYGAAPRFPMDTLPAALVRFIEYQALSVGADPAAIAMSALTVCSGALSQEFRLKIQKTGDWHVRPRLWTVLIGDPSVKKTPVISACVKPLRAHEHVGADAYKSAYARWKADKGDATDEPTRPIRYIFNDITSEKLGEILSRQDRGALVDVDELSGWIGAMDKYAGGKGSAADRSFWLQAYNGGGKTIDRLSRGETFIKNLCVAFLGGIQPDRLAQLTDLTTDGLLQRFLPVMMRKASFPQEVDDDLPAKRYDDLVLALANAQPGTLRFDEGALVAADQFRRYLFDLEAVEGLGKSFCSFVGKLAGVHGSLSLLLHMIEDPRDGAYTQVVSERVCRAAARIIEDFIIPHALALYQGSTDGGDWDLLRHIASFILTSPKDRFTASDFTNNIRALQGLSVWDVAQKVSPLVAGGWLQEDGNGVPAKAWIIVPGLREALSERRETEAKRKIETQKRLRKIRDGVDEE